MSITTRELIGLIADKDVVVSRCSTSCNLFGEFLFVGLRYDKTNECRTYYGAGYHEYREKYMVDEWECFSSRDKGTVRLPILDVVHQIQVADGIAYREQQDLTTPSENAVMYGKLVDEIGDEDAVLAQMQDMGVM